MKNRTAKVHRAARLVNAPFKLAITGTPLENSVMELWSLLSITAPGLFPYPDSFKEHYAVPIERNADVEMLAQLRRRVRPLLKRRTKEQVAPELPPKQEQVLSVDLEHRAPQDLRPRAGSASARRSSSCSTTWTGTGSRSCAPSRCCAS